MGDLLFFIVLELVLQHDASLLPKANYSVDSDNIYSNVLSPSGVVDGLLHDYGTTSKYAYVGHRPSSRVELADKMAFQMFCGSDGVLRQDPGSFYSEAYIMTAANCLSLMRPVDGARHGYSSWRDAGEISTVFMYCQIVGKTTC
jgi:hypothetical protein